MEMSGNQSGMSTGTPGASHSQSPPDKRPRLSDASLFIHSPRILNAHADAELKKLTEARTRALLIASYLDLTSLNEEDTDEVITKLCDRAKLFKVAAVCVYPKFVKKAVEQLNGTLVKVASVANFPQGSEDLERTLDDVQQIRSSGGHEVDVVLPYSAFKGGKEEVCREFLISVKQACVSGDRMMKLKVIIESGELETEDLISKATKLCLEIGADFVKTSTGKTKVSATLPTAECILRTISEGENGDKVGFKASGGVRTVEEAEKYLRLVESFFRKDGEHQKITSERFRIGASGLLNDIERIVNIKADTTSVAPLILQDSPNTVNKANSY